MAERPWARRAAGLARRALDAVLPPRCLACGGEVTGATGVCPRCWAGLNFLAPPWCAACGRPFPYDVGGDARCVACNTTPPAYATARAALAYDGASRSLILGFKHGDRTLAAPTFAGWMARAAAAELAAADLVVPVPLHPRRLLRRRYNQSAVIAQALGPLVGRPVLFDALLRVRATPSQGRLDRARRRANVAGAFAVAGRRMAAIQGRAIALIDDVLTSGATAEAAARTLTAAGAAAVHVVTLARVLDTDEPW